MSHHITDSITNLTAGLHPARSKSQSSTYTAPTVSDQQLNTAYEASALVQRVVDIVAEDMTAHWREWQGEADQISKIEDLERELGLQQKVKETIINARVQGDGYIYMDNGEDAEEPLTPDSARPLRFITALDRWDVAEGTYEDDPIAKGYGQPKYYEFVGATEILRVHPTRMVHMVGRKRRDSRRYGRLGQSVIPALLDSMKSYDAVMANIADMTWEAKIDVFGVMDLMRKVQDPEELAAVIAKYNLVATQKGVNGMIVHDMSEESYQQKSLSFATLPDIIDRFEVGAAGAAMIPRSKLFGVQTGGLGNAGESDDKTYTNRIKAKQENELTPAMSILDEMLIRTAIGSRPPELHYNWRALSTPDAKQLAEIGDLIVKKWVAAVGAGIYSAEFATEPMTNELVEAGCSPGLEGYLADYMGAMNAVDTNMEEETE